jgi:hypothetical protein
MVDIGTLCLWLSFSKMTGDRDWIEQKNLDDGPQNSWAPLLS